MNKINTIKQAKYHLKKYLGMGLVNVKGVEWFILDKKRKVDLGFRNDKDLIHYVNEELIEKVNEIIIKEQVKKVKLHPKKRCKDCHKLYYKKHKCQKKTDKSHSKEIQAGFKKPLK